MAHNLLRNHVRSFREFSWLVSAASLCALVAGCNDPVGKTVPVSGTIFVNGHPLTAGQASLVFKPDNSKGNNTRFEPAGLVDEEGNYELYTAGKLGAPPGWYKVVIVAYGGADPKPKRSVPGIIRLSLVDQKYGSEKTSDITIEAVDSPGVGAYDLHLTKTKGG